MSSVAWGSLAQPQAPSSGTWGHFLHTGLWRTSLRPCLVPLESINYLKPGEKRRAVPAAPPLAHKVQLVPSIQRPFSRGGRPGARVSNGEATKGRQACGSYHDAAPTLGGARDVTTQGAGAAVTHARPCVLGPWDRIALTPDLGQWKGGPHRRA